MKKRGFILMLAFLFAVSPFLYTVQHASAMSEESSSIEEMIALVDHFADQGEFENESAVRALKLHLTAASHFEKQGQANKLFEHMKSFHELLRHQQEHELISNTAHFSLLEKTDALIKEAFMDQEMTFSLTENPSFEEGNGDSPPWNFWDPQGQATIQRVEGTAKTGQASIKFENARQAGVWQQVPFELGLVGSSVDYYTPPGTETNGTIEIVIEAHNDYGKVVYRSAEVPLADTAGEWATVEFFGQINDMIGPEKAETVLVNAMIHQAQDTVVYQDNFVVYNSPISSGDNENNEQGEQVSDLNHLMALVETLADEGEFTNDSDVNTLLNHLTVVDHYAGEGETERVIQQMEAFKTILTHLYQNNLITDDAYSTLFAASDGVIQSFQPVYFDTPSLNIELASPHEGMGLRSLKNAVTDEEFLAENVTKTNPIIWKLELTTDMSKKDKLFTIDNTAPADRRSYTKEDDKIILTWEGVKVPNEDGEIDVTAEIAVSDFHDMTDWKIYVDYDNEKAKLWRVIFPVVDFGTIGGTGEDDYYLTSTYEGRAVRNPIGKEVLDEAINVDGPVEIRDEIDYGISTQRPTGNDYPNQNMLMQLTAYYEQKDSFYYPDREPGTALYMAAHDGDGYPKVFYATANPDETYFEYEIAHYPDENSTTGTYEQPYPVVFGGYQGGWFEAAEFYREWALEQRWAAKGPLTQRDDAPNWLLNMNAIYRGTVAKNPNEGVLPQVESYRDILDGPMMIQWYDWSTKEKREDYPGYAFPPESEAPEGFLNIVDRLQSNDIFVFPYVNARLWERDHPLFHLLANDMMIRPNGEPYYYGNQNTVRISPHSEVYKHYLAQISKELVSQYGVKGLYLDQGGSAHFNGNWEDSGDFNPNTTDHPGVNQTLVHAEHERFQAIADAVHEIDPEVVLSGENPSEYFIDTFANRLTRTSLWPGYVPLFQAVYHDYTTSYGRNVHVTSRYEDDPRASLEVGWLLTQGYQIGRLMSHALDNDVTAYLADAVALKTQYPQYLNYGQMLKPPATESDIPYIVTQEESYALKGNSYLPVLLASSWKAEDGSSFIVVTNVGQEQSHRATFIQKYHDLGLKFRPVQVEQVYPKQSQTENIRIMDDALQLSVELGPMETVAFRIDPVSTTLNEINKSLQDARDLVADQDGQNIIQDMLQTLDGVDLQSQLDHIISAASVLHSDLTQLRDSVGEQDDVLSVIQEAEKNVIRLAQMALPLNIDVHSDPLINGQEANMEFQLKNESDQNVTNLQVTVDFPEHWDQPSLEKELDELAIGEVRNTAESFAVSPSIPQGDYPITVTVNFTYDHMELSVTRTQIVRVTPPVNITIDAEDAFRVYKPGQYAFELQLSNNVNETIHVQLDEIETQGITVNIPEHVTLSPLEEKSLQGRFDILPALSEGNIEAFIQPTLNGQAFPPVTLPIHYDSNLIYNPGFEQPTSSGNSPDGWALSNGNGKWVSDTTFSGQHAIRLDPYDQFNVIHNNIMRIPVTQGKTYLFKAQAKSDLTKGTARVGVREIDEDGVTVTYHWINIDHQSDWNPYGVSFTPHSRTDTVSIYFEMRDEADASAWVDDVSLVEVPLSATLSSEMINVTGNGDYAIPLQLTNVTSHLLELEIEVDGLPEGMSLDFEDPVEVEAEQTLEIEGNLHVSAIQSEQPYHVSIRISSKGKEIAALPLTIEVNRNLVRNPGFEDGNQNYGPGGWHMVGLEKWTQEEKHSGEYAAAIHPEAYPSLLYSSPIPVEQGKTYRMSAWVKNDSSSGNLSLGVRDISEQRGTLRYIWEQTTPLSDWTKYTIEFTPTENTKHVGLYFQATEKDGVSIDGTGWVDDFRLEVVEN